MKSGLEGISMRRELGRFRKSSTFKVLIAAFDIVISRIGLQIFPTETVCWERG